MSCDSDGHGSVETVCCAVGSYADMGLTKEQLELQAKGYFFFLSGLSIIAFMLLGFSFYLFNQ